MATPQTATFNKQLKQALKHYADPDRLAKESVLATAYFLGHAGSTEGEAHWGVLLRQLLLRAGHSLWGETAPQSRDEVEAAWQELLAAPGSLRYHYLVLELRYFQEFFRPRSLQQIWQEFLQQSRAEFYRDVDRAVEALAEALLTLLQPGARLEPLPRTEPLLGREALLERTRVALMAGQSVVIARGQRRWQVEPGRADRGPMGDAGSLLVHGTPRAERPPLSSALRPGRVLSSPWGQFTVARIGGKSRAPG